MDSRFNATDNSIRRKEGEIVKTPRLAPNMLCDREPPTAPIEETKTNSVHSIEKEETVLDDATILSFLSIVIIMSSKLDYLSKYLAADPKEKKRDKKKKKKKKSRKNEEERLIVKDEDDDLNFGTSSGGSGGAVKASVFANDDDDDENDEDEDGPLIVNDGEVVVTDRTNPRGQWESVEDKGTKVAPPPARRRYDSSDDEEEDAVGKEKVALSSSCPQKRYDSSDESEEESSKRRSSKRSRRRHDSDEDEPSKVRVKKEPTIKKEALEQRRRYDSSDDEQKPTKKKRHDSSSSDNDDDDDDDDQKAARMSSGHKAGLQTGKGFAKAEEGIQKKRKVQAQEMVDRYGMGETVHRKSKDTTSNKRIELTAEQQAELNQGRKQKENAAFERAQLGRIQQSEFARRVDDDEIEALRKQSLREGDPMARYAQQQQQQPHKKSKGSKHQQPLAAARPIYKGPPPKPNRFGIRPGFRWDGNDRGNGFEDRLLAQRSSKNQQREDAYRWSSAAM